MQPRRMVMGFALVIAGIVVGPPAASADRVAVTRITGTSPLPGTCPQPFAQFPDSEAEFTLAADPRDPSRLTTAWLQAPLASEVAGFSRNGGRSFTRVVIPSLQRCTGGPFDSSGDGTLSEGPDGMTYLATLTDPNALDVNADLWVNRSRDQGQTWSPPVFVDHRNDSSQADDQPTVTADPFKPGRAYLVWSERAKRPAPGGMTSQSPELFFSRTTDGGKLWSTPRALAPEPPSLGVATGRLAVPAPGRLVCVYSAQDVFAGTFVPKIGKTTTFMAVRSKNGGSTWTSPVRLGTAPTLQPSDPGTGKQVRAMAAHNFAVAADASGDVYAAWADIRRSSSTLRFVSSRDSGRSWSNVKNITGRAAEPLFPVLAVGPDGAVGMTFYDWRGYRPKSSSLTTQVWFRRSRDRGRTWRESRIGGPFDMRQAPFLPPSLNLSGYFLGEYQGLVGVPGGFIADFAQARPRAVQGLLDGFAAHIRLSRGK